MNAKHHTEVTLRNAIRLLRFLADCSRDDRLSGAGKDFPKNYLEGAEAGFRSAANRIEETFLPPKNKQKRPFLGVTIIRPKK